MSSKKENEDDEDQEELKLDKLCENQDLEEDRLDTKCVSADRREEHYVGRLPNVTTATVPKKTIASDNVGNSIADYVFLSHTGRDDVKEEIARPTQWFLEHILRVHAFLDDGSTKWGQNKLEGMAIHAFTCTHALVILSPTFRQRKWCVRELNAFMHRLRQQQPLSSTTDPKTDPKKQVIPNRHRTFEVLPVLWRLDSARGYHTSVNNLIRISSGSTKTPAYFMIQILWPKLLEALHKHPMHERQLKYHFAEYVRAHWAGPRQLPQDFFRLVKDWGITSLPTSLSTFPTSSRATGDDNVEDKYRTTFFGAMSKSAGSSCSPGTSSAENSESTDSGDDKLLVGVAFYNVYKDKDLTWNANILERKDHIEQCLRRIACYGEITYGRARMEKKRRNGAAVVRLKCEIELYDDLTTREYRRVQRALKVLVTHLRQAGTRDAELKEMMIGSMWRSSLSLLLEAPDAILELLYRRWEQSDRQLELGSLDLDDVIDGINSSHRLILVGLTPAFTVRGILHQSAESLLGSLQDNEPEGGGGGNNENDAVVLWSAVDTMSLLMPTSELARGKVLASGVPFDHWQAALSGNAEESSCWQRELATVQTSTKALKINDLLSFESKIVLSRTPTPHESRDTIRHEERRHTGEYEEVPILLDMSKYKLEDTVKILECAKGKAKASSQTPEVFIDTLDLLSALVDVKGTAAHKLLESENILLKVKAALRQRSGRHHENVTYYMTPNALYACRLTQNEPTTEVILQRLFDNLNCAAGRLLKDVRKNVGPRWTDVNHRKVTILESDKKLEVAATKIAKSVRASVSAFFPNLPTVVDDISAMAFNFSWGVKDSTNRQQYASFDHKVLAICIMTKEERLVRKIIYRRNELRINLKLIKLMAKNSKAEEICGDLVKKKRNHKVKGMGTSIKRVLERLEAS